MRIITMGPKVILWLLTIVALLTGCTGAARPTSWPGLTVAEDVMYVASGEKVYALEVETGIQEWEFFEEEEDFFQQLKQFPKRFVKFVKGEPPAAKVRGPFYATPAVWEDVVFIGSNSSNLYALRVEEDDKRPEADTFLAAEKPIIAGPTVVGDTVYVASADNKVYALEAATGEEQWEKPFATDNWVWAKPLVADDKVYVGSMDHKMYCLDAESGQKQWEFETGGAIAAPPTLAGETLYFGAFDGKVYALKAATGEKRWDFPTDGWVWGPPLVVDDTVYVGSMDKKVYALNAATGEERWEEPSATGGAVVAGPAFAKDVPVGDDLKKDLLFVASEDKNLYALDAATGQMQWQPPFSATASIFTPPVVADGVVYICSQDGRVYALDAANRNQRWAFPRTEQ